MSTISQIIELVGLLEKMMKHNIECCVLPLYARLPDELRKDVTEFDNLNRTPGNEGKRLICVATNVAEAGVTIPGEEFCILSCILFSNYSF